MADTEGGALRKVLSLGIFLLNVLVLGLLFVMKGKGVVGGEFFILYLGLGLFCIVMSAIAFVSDFVIKDQTDNMLAKAFFIFEKSKLRPGSLLFGIPVVLFIGLAIGVFVLISSSGLTLVHTPSFAAQSLDVPLSQDVLAAHSQTENFFLGAVVPGIFEEGAWFWLIQATVFLILLLVYLFNGRDEDMLDNPILFWGATLISLFAWSAMFALAHGRFGGNQELYFTAFIFETSVQIVNLVTGSFGSWIVHISHNAAIVARNSFSFLLLSAMPFFRMEMLRWRFSHE